MLSFAKCLFFFSYAHIDFIAEEEKWKNKMINFTALESNLIIGLFIFTLIPGKIYWAKSLDCEIPGT